MSLCLKDIHGWKLLVLLNKMADFFNTSNWNYGSNTVC